MVDGRVRDQAAAEGETRIDRLLLAALDLEGAARDALLDAECGDDEGMRSVIEAALAKADETSFLDRGLADVAGPALGELAGRSGVAAGAVVGCYRLVEEIGSGGQSRVFLAGRVDGDFEQEAAVKFSRHFVGDRGEAERRFRAERQILARLSHPNIAQILDGGLSESGRPYLVMEYLPGRSITAHCRQIGADLGERLRLFAEVCEAVSYAHSHLIVHRDIKPSNIQVTDDGRVKLLDFGIAKLLDPTDPLSAHTRTGLFALTPQYAAPEQLRGDPVTTATDLYALGLVLYELLTGERPFGIDGKSPSEIERLVCDTEPRLPSTVPMPEASERDPSFPRAALRGDLDTIVLKTLRKEPAERYRTVRELVDDLERHQQGLPVRARPATVRYRLAKFVRRNTAGVAAAVLLLATILGALVTVTLEQRETARERDRALLEERKAQQVTDFMMGLFEAAEPVSAEANADTVTARILLEEGVRQVDDLTGEPGVQGELLRVIGRAYRTLGDPDAAAIHLERALAVERQRSAEPGLGVARTLSELAELKYSLGDQKSAVSLRRQALSIFEAAGAAGQRDAISELGHLASDVGEMGNLAEEESLLKRMIELGRRPGLDPDLSTQIHRQAATLAYHREEFEIAEEEGRAALAVLRTVHGEEHLEIADQHRRIGAALLQQKRFTEAEEYLQRALDQLRKILGPAHPKVISALGNLGTLKAAAGDFTTAESLEREALELSVATNGRVHPSTAMRLNNLAVLLSEIRRLDEAGDLYHEALRIRLELHGPDHPEVQRLQSNLAFLYLRAGRLEEARAMARAALEGNRRNRGEAHPSTSTILDSLVLIELDLGNLAEAESLARESLEISRRFTEEDNLKVASSLAVLGLALVARGDLAEAERHLRDSLALERRFLPDDHPRVARRLEHAASVLEKAGAAEEAGAMLEESLAIRRAALGEDHPEVERTRGLLDRLRQGEGG